MAASTKLLRRLNLIGIVIKKPAYSPLISTGNKLQRCLNTYLTRMDNYSFMTPNRRTFKAFTFPQNLRQLFIVERRFSNYTNDSGRDNEKGIKPIFVAIPNPFKLIRNKIYFWMIRSYFDADFSPDEFAEGAKQALSTISGHIADGNLKNLEGLLSEKLLQEVTLKCESLALKDRANIHVSTDDVLHIFPQNMAIHYDDSGGKFLNILMRFWCHSAVSDESDARVMGLRLGRPPPGVSEEAFKKMGSVISCTYEFHRDFTAGCDSSWIVTYIQHGKWLNTEARWLPREWTK